MKFISKFFEERKQRKLEIEKALQEQAKAKAEKEAEEQKMAIIMESDVPWFKLIGAEYDLENPPKQPISERYQWNKAFIRHLRELGHRGETDHIVIEAWEQATAVEKAKRMVELDRKRKRESSEPWVEIVSEKYDEIAKAVEINLDWNPAFITMLRKNGYTGASEAELVDKYFKRLSENIAQNLHDTNYDD